MSVCRFTWRRKFLQKKTKNENGMKKMMDLLVCLLVIMQCKKRGQFGTWFFFMLWEVILSEGEATSEDTFQFSNIFSVLKF